MLKKAIKIKTQAWVNSTILLLTVLFFIVGLSGCNEKDKEKIQSKTIFKKVETRSTVTKDEAKARLKGLRKKIKAMGIDAIILTDNIDIFYISGFLADNGTVIAVVGEEIALISSRLLFINETETMSSDWNIDFSMYKIEKPLAAVTEGMKKIGIDSDVSLSLYNRLQKAMPEKCELTIISSPVAEMRMSKEKREIELIKKAISIAASAFNQVKPTIKSGMSELEVVASLNYAMMANGADGLSFDTMVVSGPNAAKPHGKPANRTIQNGDIVTIDFGLRKNGYCTDVSRTFVLGDASEPQQKLMNNVKKAQQLAASVISIGIPASKPDITARKYFKNKGFSDIEFNHGLGHGVGISVHEMPLLYQTNTTKFVKQTVFTIEPGLYIKGVGGCRFEDMYLLTEEGVEQLTSNIY